jgi:hypothetical protein
VAEKITFPKRLMTAICYGTSLEHEFWVVKGGDPLSPIVYSPETQKIYHWHCGSTLTQADYDHVAALVEGVAQ